MESLLGVQDHFEKNKGIDSPENENTNSFVHVVNNSFLDETVENDEILEAHHF